ncbi:hypothetical protein [Parachlamydia acanthamoebae]|jgi:hypothetical protein|uniref:hypothetical protein n=1 Tax=Parachlamydia acanthamoebae TaxID=83552 RepID=UPI0001C172B3|nr:hypothetical protein [Parachlamydia acanthamoebae]EFB41480.1 hypothetical protein pah_c032o042 [Parachlamydia acanthamoebae str. Hall's coccus]
MNSSTLWLMTLLVLVGMGILFLMNFSPNLNTASIQKNHIDLNDIKAVTIEREGKPHTLSLEQQVELVKYLNLSQPVEKKTYENQNDQVDFEKIIIYRFKHPELTITPVGYIGQNLLFSAPDLNPLGYMLDFSDGKLKNLIAQSIEK